MRATITYQLQGRDYTTADITPGDFVRWEIATRQKTSDLANGVGMADMARLVYSHLERVGHVPCPWDVFCDQLLDIEWQDVEENPTQSGVSQDS
jgi:hypothetical protein